MKKTLAKRITSKVRKTLTNVKDKNRSKKKDQNTK